MRVVSTMSTKTASELSTRTTTRRSAKNKEKNQKQNLKSYCKSVVKNIVHSTLEELELLETKIASLKKNKGTKDNSKVFQEINLLHKKLLSEFIQLTRYRWSFSDSTFINTEVDECYFHSKNYLSAAEKCKYVNTFLNLEERLIHSLSNYVILLEKRCKNNGVNDRKNNGGANTGNGDTNTGKRGAKTGKRGAKTGNGGTITAKRGANTGSEGANTDNGGTNTSLSSYSSAHENPSSRSATPTNTKGDSNDGLSLSFSAYENASSRSRSTPSGNTKGDRNNRGRLIKLLNLLERLGVKVKNMSLFDDKPVNKIGQVGKGETTSNDLCEILEDEKKLLQSTKELRTVRESILDSKDISDLCGLESVRQSLGGFHMKPSQPIPNNNTTLHLRGVPVSTSRSALHHS